MPTSFEEFEDLEIFRRLAEPTWRGSAHKSTHDDTDSRG